MSKASGAAAAPDSTAAGVDSAVGAKDVRCTRIGRVVDGEGKRVSMENSQGKWRCCCGFCCLWPWQRGLGLMIS